MRLNPAGVSERLSARESMRAVLKKTLVAALGVMSASCVPPREAPSVQLQVMADPSGLHHSRNDLGYEIHLHQARVVVQNLAFAVDGEAHGEEDAPQASLLSWFIPRAYAHPGHFEGGEVTGELKGRFVLDWFAHSSAPQAIGTAFLLVGNYTSANFLLGRGGPQDGLAPEDPLYGHTAILRGQARKGGQVVDFLVEIDSVEGREVIGIPFELQVSEDTRGPLGFRLHTLGVIDQQSLFNGIDFSKLRAGPDGVVHIHGQSEGAVDRLAYTRIRRGLQTQEQFDIQATTVEKLARQAAELAREGR